MNITFTKEFEKAMQRCFEGFNKLGINIEMPPSIEIENTTYNILGKITPRVSQYAVAHIKFIIPENCYFIEKQGKHTDVKL